MPKETDQFRRNYFMVEVKNSTTHSKDYPLYPNQAATPMYSTILTSEMEKLRRIEELYNRQLNSK